MDIFRFQVERFPQKTLFVKVVCRFNKAPFVGIGASHKGGFAFFAHLPEHFRLFITADQRDVRENIDIVFQTGRAEFCVDMCRRFHQQNIDLFLRQHGVKIFIKAGVGESLRHGLLTALGFVPEIGIDVARGNGNDLFCRLAACLKHIAPPVTCTDQRKTDFLHNLFLVFRSIFRFDSKI